MKISVIIPVYNAEKYLEKAVNSVLIQPEVGEIILVEDKSPDNALEICRNLDKNNDIIKLIQHADKENHGAGASRNLGIKYASCEYIAFLDADDYYLPGRFAHETQNLFGNNGVDGMYGALGFHYYNDEQKKELEQDTNKELTTIEKIVPANELFNALIGLHKDGYIGHIHLDTLTVNKSVFDTVGMFNIDLRLHQDFEWLMRASFDCNFIPGSINNAVGMRGVHLENRIASKSYKSQIMLWSSMLQWAKNNYCSNSIQRHIKKKIFLAKSKDASKFSSFFLLLKYSNIEITYRHPIFEDLVYKAFGKNILAKLILGSRNRILGK